VTSSLSLRTFSEASIEAFTALAATYCAEGHEARNPEYLRWAFLRNPAGGAGKVACAEAPDGSWSGMMGMVPFRIRHGERVFTVYMGLYGPIKPGGYRGRLMPAPPHGRALLHPPRSAGPTR